MKKDNESDYRCVMIPKKPIKLRSKTWTVRIPFFWVVNYSGPPRKKQRRKKR